MTNGRKSNDVPTTEMKVTSIRLEKQLIEELKAMKHPEGYQFLIRKVLWNYVRRTNNTSKYDEKHIEGRFEGYATMEQACALTGRLIRKNDRCQYGITIDGSIVPIALY